MFLMIHFPKHQLKRYYMAKYFNKEGKYQKSIQSSTTPNYGWPHRVTTWFSLAMNVSELGALVVVLLQYYMTFWLL